MKAAIASGSSGMIPLWTFNVTSTRDGNSYSGEMVGESAFSAPNSSTTITTQIVPIIFVMPDGGVFDPTVHDPCAAAPGGSAVSLTLGSPIVNATHFTLNGDNVGNTQYPISRVTGEVRLAKINFGGKCVNQALGSTGREG